MVELLAKSGDPDQTPHSAASDLGLHCLSPFRTLQSTMGNRLIFRFLFTGTCLLQKHLRCNIIKGTF